MACGGHRGPFGKKRAEQAKSPVSCAARPPSLQALLSSGENHGCLRPADNLIIVLPDAWTLRSHTALMNMKDYKDNPV